MIVVDEQIHGERIRSAISAWYPGQVESITRLRPNTVIKDDAIPMLLKQVRQPTFVTINADDFWRRASADSAYCIVAIPLPHNRKDEVPLLLRDLLRLPSLKTRALRMDNVLRVLPTSISYYGADWVVHSLAW